MSLLMTSMALGDPGASAPSPARPLVVDGVARAIEHAELSLRVETETWDGASQTWIYQRTPSIVLSLEVRVDEHSGEDGALAPDLYFHLPSDAPPNLAGFVLDEKKNTAEAWWGNDAPALVDNRLELKSELKEGSVQVRWTATSERGAALLFEGPVEFMGMSLKVKSVTDVEGFLRTVWPALDATRLDLISESEVDFGEDMPEDRRHWMELHYDFR